MCVCLINFQYDCIRIIVCLFPEKKKKNIYISDPNNSVQISLQSFERELFLQTKIKVTFCTDKE